MAKKRKTKSAGHAQNKSINGQSRKSDESQENNTETFEGIEPKIYEKEVDFFRQKSWELVTSSIDRIEETAKSILSSSAILSGIYFAALKISPVEKLNLLSPLKKSLFLFPLLCWLFSFLFSFLTIGRRKMRINPDDQPEEIKEMLIHESTRKYRLLVTASIFLVISIGFLIYNLYLLFFLS